MGTALILGAFAFGFVAVFAFVAVTRGRSLREEWFNL